MTYTLLLSAYENMIRWARFSGQNTIVLPVQQYYQIYYQRPGPRAVMWGCCYEKDSIGLMARLAELNGLKVVLNIEWSNRDNIEQLDRFTNLQVKQGADTVRPVMRDGKQFRRYAGIGYNFQHPRVEAEILATVDDLLAQAAPYAAVKGLSFYQIPDYAPCAYRRGGDPTDVSFDDASIRRFAREGGVRVPVPLSDPDRFRKRSEWVYKNAWDEYVQWRCDAVTSLIRRIAARVRARRPDWRCSFHWGANQMHGLPSLDAGLRSWGIDARAIGQIDGVLQGIKEWIGSEKVYWNRHKRFYDFVLYSPEGDTFGMTKAIRQTNLDALMPPGRRCSWGFNFFVDSSRAGTVCYELAPCRAHYLAHYADILSHSTPEFHGFGVGDNSLHSGPEQEVRAVARVLRTLPKGVYRTLTGNGLDRNLVVRAIERKPHLYFYVVNVFPWPAQGHLTLSQSGRVLNLIENAECRGKEIALDLGPSEIRTFRVDIASGPRPLAARVALCETGVEELSATARRAHAAMARLKAGDVFLDPNTATPAKIEAALADAGDALQAQSHARAYRLLNSRPIVYLFAAKPVRLWHIIGPFDHPGGDGLDGVTQAEKDILAGAQPAGSYVAAGRAQVTWAAMKVPTPDGTSHIDFMKTHMAQENAVCYAWTVFASDRDRSVLLKLGSDDGIKVWVNGKVVHRKAARRSAQPSADTARSRLKKGLNPILLKIEQDVGGWGFYFQVTDLRGKALE